MSISRSILSVFGVKTAVNTRSSGRPAVLCIHGNSLNSTTFDSLFENPDFADYSIISYDLPGHGVSGGPEQPETDYSFTGYSKHLRSLIETLELDDFIILGHSLGGHIAIQALSAGMFKGLRGLFLIGTPPLSCLDDSTRAFIAPPEGTGFFSEQFSDSTLQFIVSRYCSAVDYQDELKKMIRSTKPEARAFTGRNLALYGLNDEKKTIAELKIPLSVNFGADDRILNKDYYDDPGFLDLKNPDSSINLLSGVEHIPEWESFTAASSGLLEFIRKIDDEY